MSTERLSNDTQIADALEPIHLQRGSDRLLADSRASL